MRRGSCTEWMLYSGTQRRVTVESTPRAPRPTCAALNVPGSWSGEQRSTSPLAVTSESAATWLEMFRNFSPVPCVAVEMAPEMVW